MGPPNMEGWVSLARYADGSTPGDGATYPGSCGQSSPSNASVTRRSIASSILFWLRYGSLARQAGS